MVTMKDVAREANVTTATVSYVLNGTGSVGAGTRARVLDAAKRLNYTKNLAAMKLRSGKNGIIGLALYDVGMPYAAELSKTASIEALRHGLQLLVQQTSSSKAEERSIIETITNQFCDGMIMMAGALPSEEIHTLSRGKPVVLIDDHSPDSPLDSIFTPCREGAKTAISRLIAEGRRNIVMLGVHATTFPLDEQSTRATVRYTLGYRDAMEEAGLTVAPDNFVICGWTSREAYEATARLLETGRRFDGVFCMSDSMAIGALSALNDHGVRVPEEVSLIGFDGIDEGNYTTPKLTTVATDTRQLAGTAVTMLLDRIERPDSGKPPQRVTIGHRLIERGTTLPV
ncbi:Periplasmic binding protein-like domain-containing protein [Bifidobacterium avesanii]|nr:Periplasmic binding protein-like domain-containing protein [Bifidobacterium avesanii]